VNPDGTMDTIWTIRPNVKWHDGTPFTSEDLVFTYNVRKENATLAAGAASTLRLMTSVSAPDPHTFAIRWREVSARADEAVGLDPLPRHLLEAAYQNNPDTIANHPYFRTEYVGLGPYKLVTWSLGLEMNLARNPEYYRTPARIDEIVLKFVPDPTAMVANILSGAVDVVLPPGVELDAAAAVKRQWEGTGNHVTIGGTDDLNSGYTLQVRQAMAKPVAGLPNRDVREALLRAIDREEMSQALTAGLAPVADSWVAPTHALRPAIGSAIPQYNYDLNRASQLLAQAGWTRGPEGILLHNQTGERFTLELAGPARVALQKQQAIISDGWKPLGVEGEIFVVPSAMDLVAENRSTRPGIYLGSIAAERYYYQDQLHSREITSSANWQLRNRGGYSNPAIDALHDQLRVTIDQNQRVSLQRDLARTAMEDVALWPLYWDVYPVLAIASVKADIRPAKGGTLTNITEWDKL
jgi:peptide/nickel transport system substrate-binding protein